MWQEYFAGFLGGQLSESLQSYMHIADFLFVSTASVFVLAAAVAVSGNVLTSLLLPKADLT